MYSSGKVVQVSDLIEKDLVMSDCWTVEEVGKVCLGVLKTIDGQLTMLDHANLLAGKSICKAKFDFDVGATKQLKFKADDPPPLYFNVGDAIVVEEEAPAGESQHLPIEPAPEESGDMR